MAIVGNAYQIMKIFALEYKIGQKMDQGVVVALCNKMWNFVFTAGPNTG